MTTRAHIDFETRADVDIKKTGAFKYARHPLADIVCMRWAVGDGPVEGYTRADLLARKPIPHALIDALHVAHSASFEFAIWKYVLAPRYGWPRLDDPRQWECTLARAVTCGLPASLDGAARALRLPAKKDLAGRAIMLRVSRPKGHDAHGNPIWNEDAAELEATYRYCGQDVVVERGLDHTLPPMSGDERRVWELDLLVNDRGVAVDVEFARKAALLADEIVTYLNGRLHEMTCREHRACTRSRCTGVDAATRVAAMKKWLGTQGVLVEALDQVVVTELLARQDVSPLVKDVVNIRRQVGKSSTAKYLAVLEAADAKDSRVRGALQYHAAHTGRWAGRLIQPQNFPQGAKAKVMEETIADVKARDGFFAAVRGDRSMKDLSDALRGLIVAAPGKSLVSADYNAIEARTLFWLAGDETALACYRRGDSPYVDMARYIYRDNTIPATATEAKEKRPREYDLGKRTILGCGYGMGAVKFRENAYIETAKKGSPLLIAEELAERAVKAYRDKYSTVVGLWYSTEAAALAAVRNPGRVFASSKQGAAQHVTWGMHPRYQKFLVCRLPSSRLLWYYCPQIAAVDGPRGVKDELRYWADAGPGAMRVEPETGLGLYKTYGGSLVENVTQAVARDVLANGMLNTEHAGFSNVLTVHDEALAECAVHGSGEAALGAFIKSFTQLPPWAAGLPVAAEGWVGQRYHK